MFARNPNETPSSIQHISQTQHNHIGSSTHGIGKLTHFDGSEITSKQKRQLVWIATHRRNKRSRKLNYYETDDDSDESEELDSHYDDKESDEQTNHSNSHNSRDRLDDIGDTHYPYWDTYDALNQYYLEVGTKIEIKNHYRGHKLSLWLNLIPQLHMPGELSELSMRHHHFSESDAKFYDGIVREQNLEKPIVIIRTTPIRNDQKSTPTKPSTTKSITTTGKSFIQVSNKNFIRCVIQN